ncbi:MAG: hypothetical protein H0V44_13220 [Planctomycetes bacterium]|nr:hypothetical protein [Planctomycetota bacterium]
MPAPQIAPPGHLDLHVVLVALTPSLLCLATALALVAIGRRRAAGFVGWTGLGAAWLLLAVFLKPGGIASSLDAPLAQGWVVIGAWQILAALAAGAWAAFCWRPMPDGVPPAAWALRVAVAMALPICVFPPLLLACEPDLRGRPWQTDRWLQVRLVAVIGASVACWWIIAPLAMAIAAAVVAATVSGPWRLPIALACLAAIASLRAAL